jgi:hypothetical protein
MIEDTDTYDQRQDATPAPAFDRPLSPTDDQVLAACERVEVRDGPWWGPGCIARDLGTVEADVLPSLDRLHARGLVDSDVCGAGPDGVQVLAWWIVRESFGTCTDRPQPSCSRPDGQPLRHWDCSAWWVDEGDSCEREAAGP